VPGPRVTGGRGAEGGGGGASSGGGGGGGGGGKTVVEAETWLGAGCVVGAAGISCRSRRRLDWRLNAQLRVMVGIWKVCCGPEWKERNYFDSLLTYGG
jgi:hypothetical protein